MAILSGSLVTWTPPAVAAFTGTNGYISLVSNAAGGQNDVFAFRPFPVFDVQNLTNDPAANDIESQYSADGKRVVFTSNRDDPANADIYVMKADGTNVQRITTHTDFDLEPTFSPDGTQVAWVRIVGGSNYEIFVKNSDGTGPETNISNNPAFDLYPAWSPDGAKIAFSTNRTPVGAISNQFDIWSMNTNGTGQAVVVSIPTLNDLYPDYSPSGSRIVFQTAALAAGSLANIATVTPTGGVGTFQAVTTNPGNDIIPFWSPDGTSVAWTSDRAPHPGNNEVYLRAVSAAGAGVGTEFRLTTSPANDTAYDWQPIFPTDMGITKTDSPDPVVVGTALAYTIEVTNHGPNDAQGVYAVDTLPASVTFDSASPGCTFGAGPPQAVICLTGYLDVGESQSFTVNVTPNSVGTISNQAEVVTLVTDPNTSNNTDTEATVVRDLSADLSITKSDSPDPVLAGENVTYTLDVANAGPDAADSITVTDILPAGTTFVSASPADDCSELPPGTVTCSAATLASGDTTSFEIVVTTGAAGTITNQASVEAEVPPDPDTENNSASEDTVVQDAAADLSITKTDSADPVLSGENVTYTLEVANAGPGDATNVEITDTLPAGVTFVEATPPCTESSGVVTCVLLSLAAGADPAAFDITVTTGDPGTITNQASVEATEADPVTENNSDSENTVVRAPMADVSITKTDSADPVVAGSEVTYTLVVENVGPDEATNVEVTDILPAGTTFVDATAPCTESPPGTVTCVLLSLPAGQGASFDVTVTTGAAGTITNTASVKLTELDPNPANNSDSESTVVAAGAADLSITKSDSPDPVVIGDDVTYTIEVSNNGPDQATNVTVTDTLPAGVTFVSASPGCTESDGVVTCPVPDLGEGEGAPLEIVVTTTTGGTITNTATVASADVGDPDTSNNTATEETNVTGPPEPVGTVLDARPMVLDDQPALVSVRIATFVARLTDAVNGQPIEGREVVFTAPNGTELCRATTDADGTATCTTALDTWLITVLGLRYTATFAGDEQYEPSSDEGRVARLLGIDLL